MYLRVPDSRSPLPPPPPPSVIVGLAFREDSIYRIVNVIVEPSSDPTIKMDG